MRLESSQIPVKSADEAGKHCQRQFIGMVNQQSKFSLHLEDQMKPLQDLLSLKNLWRWGREQQEDTDGLKKAVSTSEVLAL